MSRRREQRRRIGHWLPKRVGVTRAQPGRAGILNNYTGGSVAAAFDVDFPYSDSRSGLVHEAAADFLEQLEPVFPGSEGRYLGTATWSLPSLDPNTRGSYSVWLVGQYTLFSGYEGVRRGKVHFAGEHCSTSFQGFMGRGAEEGARAASESPTKPKPPDEEQPKRSPTTSTGLPVEEQMRKEWDPKKAAASPPSKGRA